MDAQQAQAKFTQADVLFKQGRPQDALALLAELEAAFPNTKNILYPKALCLEKLGRLAEAEQVCDVLIQRFQDARAQALKTQLHAAASGAPAIPGLDALDFDFMKPPVTAYAAPPAAAAGARGTRKAAVALGIVGLVIVVGAVGAVGVKQGWFGGGASKFEELEARLKESFDTSGSFTAVLDASFPVPDPRIPMTIQFGGSIEYLQKDNRTYFRLEGAPSALAGMPSMAMTLVGNGEDMFMEMNMAGQTMVMKMPTPPAVESESSPSAMFAALREGFDIKSLPDTQMGGKNIWVFELTPKPGTAPDTTALPFPAPELDRVRVSCDGESLSYLKIEALDKAGATNLSLALLNVRVNPPLTPEQFAYTPPQGVQVMDMGELAGGGMLPMMPPGLLGGG